MCVACRERKEKQDLMRFVKTDEGIVLDQTKSINGRGFYLCHNMDCYQLMCKKKILNKMLSRLVTDEEYNKIKEYIDEKK